MESPIEAEYRWVIRQVDRRVRIHPAVPVNLLSHLPNKSYVPVPDMYVVIQQNQLFVQHFKLLLYNIIYHLMSFILMKISSKLDYGSTDKVILVLLYDQQKQIKNSAYISESVWATNDSFYSTMSCVGLLVCYSNGGWRDASWAWLQRSQFNRKALCRPVCNWFL